MDIPIEIVAATDEAGGIGRAGSLPWRLPGDMKLFKQLTTAVPEGSGLVNAVIMGMRTWTSIPERFRPLDGRLNVVLSRTAESAPADGVLLASSLDAAMQAAAAAGNVHIAFVIGGAEPFGAAMNDARCRKLHLTRVAGSFDCDVSLPPLPAAFKRSYVAAAVEEGGYSYAVEQWQRQASGEPGEEEGKDEEAGKRDEASSSTVSPPAIRLVPDAVVKEDASHEEWQYLDLIRDVILTGNDRDDRTGVGTLSKFGVSMRFSLADDVLPLLTTKRVFWRGVAEELLWFISGSTDARVLQGKGIHIWDGNSSRDFLDKCGFTDREEGDLGPVYGFQWRHFGAEYRSRDDDYTGEGCDQLAELVDAIRNNPTSRRLLLTAWNPAARPLMVLPPCHMFAQFYVADGALSCQMYQRSADLGLGVPFNIASYALLTRLLAQVCDLRAGELVHVIGDAHVYKNHVLPLQEQLVRQPRPFPVLHINPDKKDIDSFVYDDFTVEGYKPHKSIKMKMAV